MHANVTAKFNNSNKTKSLLCLLAKYFFQFNSHNYTTFSLCLIHTIPYQICSRYINYRCIMLQETSVKTYNARSNIVLNNNGCHIFILPIFDNFNYFSVTWIENRYKYGKNGKVFWKISILQEIYGINVIFC